MTPNDPTSSSPGNRYEDRWERRRRRWEARRERRLAWGGGRNSHFILGGTIVLFGILFLLQNLGVFYVERVWELWPVILVAAGISKLITGPGAPRRIWGGLLVASGVVLLANTTGYLPWDAWRLLWPLWLIFWGLFILLRGFGRKPWWPQDNPFHDRGTSTANSLDEVAVFGGVQRRVESQEFEGGEVTAVFGGVEIDLRTAGTKKDEVLLEVNAVFGGVELQVPESWDVTMRGAAFLGGHEDRTHPSRAQDGVKRPRLVIEGNAVFGGVSVRN